MQEKIRVLIAWYSPVLAQSLCEELEQQGDVAISCSAERHSDVPARLLHEPIDVLMVEDGMDPAYTMDLLDCVHSVSPETRCVVLVDAFDQQRLLDAIRHGATGCLPKASGRSVWAAAVRMAAAGAGWLAAPPALQPQAQPDPAAASRSLTQREREVLSMIGAGLTNKEIGRRLQISDNTVKTHLHRAYVKLHQSGRYKAYLATPPANMLEALPTQPPIPAPSPPPGPPRPMR
jgi:DNA-binding NarL/FixJ family response regulator